jgi:catechol 2,3-dioxygenase-like lactoylglutathione lyase family enzyme
MNSMLINIDVAEIEKAERFYVAAFDLRVGRRIDKDVVELLGFPSPIFLLEKKEGSLPFESAPFTRAFQRHWTPVHLDIVVDSIEIAVKKAVIAGGIFESGVHDALGAKLLYFQTRLETAFV